MKAALLLLLFLLAARALVAVTPTWSGTHIPPSAPTGHATIVSWQDDPAAPGVLAFSVYRAEGACDAAVFPARPVASGIQAGPAGLAYVDYDVQGGATACYRVTSTYAEQESEPSNKAEATTPAPRR